MSLYIRLSPLRQSSPPLSHRRVSFRTLRNAWQPGVPGVRTLHFRTILSGRNHQRISSKSIAKRTGWSRTPYSAFRPRILRTPPNMLKRRQDKEEISVSGVGRRQPSSHFISGQTGAGLAISWFLRRKALPPKKPRRVPTSRRGGDHTSFAKMSLMSYRRKRLGGRAASCRRQAGFKLPPRDKTPESSKQTNACIQRVHSPQHPGPS